MKKWLSMLIVLCIVVLAQVGLLIHKAYGRTVYEPAQAWETITLPQDTLTWMEPNILYECELNTLAVPGSLFIKPDPCTITHVDKFQLARVQTPSIIIPDNMFLGFTMQINSCEAKIQELLTEIQKLKEQLP